MAPAAIYAPEADALTINFVNAAGEGEEVRPAWQTLANGAIAYETPKTMSSRHAGTDFLAEAYAPRTGVPFAQRGSFLWGWVEAVSPLISRNSEPHTQTGNPLHSPGCGA
jgi:hypothetical protein